MTQITQNPNVFVNFDPYANLLAPNSFRILGFNGSTVFKFVQCSNPFPWTLHSQGKLIMFFLSFLSVSTTVVLAVWLSKPVLGSNSPPLPLLQRPLPLPDPRPVPVSTTKDTVCGHAVPGVGALKQRVLFSFSGVSLFRCLLDNSCALA